MSPGYCFGAPFVLDLAAEGSIVAGNVFLWTQTKNQPTRPYRRRRPPRLPRGESFPEAQQYVVNNIIQFRLLILEQDPSYFRVQVRFNRGSPPTLFLADPHHEQRMTSPFLSKHEGVPRISWLATNQVTSSKFFPECPTDSLFAVTQMYPTHVSASIMHLVLDEHPFLYS